MRLTFSNYLILVLFAVAMVLFPTQDLYHQKINNLNASSIQEKDIDNKPFQDQTLGINDLSGTCETRGVWLNPRSFATDEELNRTFEKIKNSNLNTVFIAGHDLNGNSGWSSQDRFVAAFRRAKQDGLAVHVWLSSMHRLESTTDEPVIYTKPEEKEAHKQWCLDWITKYPKLDGIHFDNLRYPSEKERPGFVAPTTQNAINETVEMCYQAIKEKDPTKLLTAAVSNVDPKSFKFNMTYLSPWYQRWLQVHPDSTYIVGNDTYTNWYRYNGNIYAPDIIDKKGDVADPVLWLKQEYIDAIFAMRYTTSVDLWKQRIPAWKTFTKRHFPKVNFGVSWYQPAGGDIERVAPYPDGTTYPGGGYDVTNVLKQINYARREEMKGFSIFEYGNRNNDDTAIVSALANGPFKEPAPSCLSSKNITQITALEATVPVEVEPTIIPTNTPRPSEPTATPIPDFNESLTITTNGNNSHEKYNPAAEEVSPEEVVPAITPVNSNDCNSNIGLYGCIFEDNAGFMSIFSIFIFAGLTMWALMSIGPL